MLVCKCSKVSISVICASHNNCPASQLRTAGLWWEGVSNRLGYELQGMKLNTMAVAIHEPQGHDFAGTFDPPPPPRDQTCSMGINALTSTVSWVGLITWTDIFFFCQFLSLSTLTEDAHFLKVMERSVAVTSLWRWMSKPSLAKTLSTLSASTSVPSRSFWPVRASSKCLLLMITQMPRRGWLKLYSSTTQSHLGTGCWDSAKRHHVLSLCVQQWAYLIIMCTLMSTSIKYTAMSTPYHCIQYWAHLIITYTAMSTSYHCAHSDEHILSLCAQWQAGSYKHAHASFMFFLGGMMYMSLRSCSTLLI